MIDNKPTILYIDDDLTSLKLLKTQLRNYDTNLITENNGNKGLDVFIENKNDIDLVILDINLHNIDGLFILSEIRKINNIVPVIMVTATNVLENISKYLESGATEYLIKPILKKDVNNLMMSYI